MASSSQVPWGRGCSSSQHQSGLRTCKCCFAGVGRLAIGLTWGSFGSLRLLIYTLRMARSCSFRAGRCLFEGVAWTSLASMYTVWVCVCVLVIFIDRSMIPWFLSPFICTLVGSRQKCRDTGLGVYKPSNRGCRNHRKKTSDRTKGFGHRKHSSVVDRSYLLALLCNNNGSPRGLPTLHEA